MKSETKFKETEIGKIPEEWDIQEVKDLGKIMTGKTPPTKESKYFGKDYPFIKIPDMGMCVRVENSETMLSHEGAQYMRSLKLPSDSVMVSCLATVGKIGITSKESFTNQQINSVIPNIDKVIPEWIYYYFKDSTEYLKSLGGGGSVYTNISKSRFGSAKIILPPLTEQRAITKILSDLDSKIELNIQMNKTLEAIGQALFKRWFVDFEFPDNEGKPYKSSGGEMVDSELGEVPRGWKAGKLGEIIENFDSKRIPLSSREREKRQGQYPYHGAAGVMDFIDDYIFDGEYLLMGEDGTVTDSNGFPILQYVWGKFWVNNHAHIIRGKEGIPLIYLFLLLKNTNVSHIVTGAVQPKINQRNMNSVEIIIPDKKTLSNFNHITSVLYSLFKNNTEENNSLVAIRDSLLPRLMSGKIRVNMGV